MLDSLSPYALLCASKPKPAATTVSPYDIYSAVQAGIARESVPPAVPASLPPHAPAPAAPHEPPAVTAAQPPQRTTSAASMPLVPTRRTHYIADIKTRHNAAARRSCMSSCPLTPPPHPSSGH